MAGLIIPTPEVSDVKDDGFYDKNYPADYKMPRQLIHVQRNIKLIIFGINILISNTLFLALSLEQDIPDYDMDSADEMWFDSQTKSELTPFKFEQMMDRLEKITVCSLDDAKALVRRNEVNQDVFDYWVNKRLKTVRTDNFALSVNHNNFRFYPFRSIHLYYRSKRKIEEILLQIIPTLHLEDELRRCKPERTVKTTKRHMRKCSS